MYYVFTDGASSKNGSSDQVGGWGYVIVDENESIVKEDFGGEKGRTNQWGELTAVAKAIEYIESTLRPQSKKSFVLESEVNIYSDSAYIIRCRNEGWYLRWLVNGWLNNSKQPVVNRELWEKIIFSFDDNYYDYIKVKSHLKGNSFLTKWNNYADNLAVKGRCQA